MGEQSILAKLRQENSFLTRAKEQLHEDFLSYKREVSLIKGEETTKEVKILKKVVKNLEVNFLYNTNLIHCGTCH